MGQPTESSRRRDELTRSRLISYESKTIPAGRRTLNTGVAVAAVLLLSIQVDETALLTRLKALDDAAASKIIAAETSATRASLDRLLEQVDASVHSDRQRPEQRRVQYDREALTLGLRVSSLLAGVTGDRAYSRRFDARKQRLDGTQLLNDRRYRDALKPLNAALVEAQSVGDKWLQAIARVNLAYGHLELGHGQEALAQSQGAAEIASSLDDKARGLTLYNLGSVHLHLKNFERSVGTHGRLLPSAGRPVSDCGKETACSTLAPLINSSATSRLRASSSSRPLLCWRKRKIASEPAARFTTWVSSLWIRSATSRRPRISSAPYPSFAKSTSDIRTRSSWMRSATGILSRCRPCRC